MGNVVNTVMFIEIIGKEHAFNSFKQLFVSLNPQEKQNGQQRGFYVK